MHFKGVGLSDHGEWHLHWAGRSMVKAGGEHGVVDFSAWIQAVAAFGYGPFDGDLVIEDEIMASKGIRTPMHLY